MSGERRDALARAVEEYETSLLIDGKGDVILDDEHYGALADAALAHIRAVLSDPATVEAVARTLEDECLQRLGRDLGTIHRDDITRAVLAVVAQQIGAEQ